MPSVSKQSEWTWCLAWLVLAGCASAQVQTCGAHPGAARAAAEIRRWGATPHTRVTWSFVEVAYTEAAENPPVQVVPIVDGENSYPGNARALVRAAFDRWTQVADIDLVEVDDSEPGQIRIGGHGFGQDILGHGFFPGAGEVAGDVHLAIGISWHQNQFFVTALHEIGHGLGLEHVTVEPTFDAVVMYVTIPFQAGDLNAKDIAYAQGLYGPVIPALTSTIGSDREIALTWTYPAGLERLTAVLTVAATTVDIAFDAATDRHALTGFEVQRTPLQLTSVHDGAEDDQVRLFDETLDEFDGLAMWERNDVRVGSGSLAYHIDNRQFDSFIGSYRLASLMPFEATATSRLQFQRAALMGQGTFEEQTFAESITYAFRRLATETTVILETEIGSDRFPDPVPGFEARDFDLGAEAGAQLEIVFTYNYEGIFWPDDRRGVSLDEVTLVDVLVPDAALTVTTSQQEPAARSTVLTGIAVGEYQVALRALFADQLTSAISLSGRATVPEPVSNDPPTPVDDSYTLVEDDALDEPAPGVLANDSDPDGDSVSVAVAVGPGHGVLDLSTDGGFHYTPDPDFAGSDSFTYTITDMLGASAVAAVQLTVENLPDRPLISSFHLEDPILGRADATHLAMVAVVLAASDADDDLSDWAFTAEAEPPAPASAAWLPALPAQIELPATGQVTMHAWVRDATGLVNLAGANQATISYQPPEVFRLQPADGSELTLGTWADAENGIDAGLDLPASDETVTLLDAATGTRLLTDFRPAAAVTRWRLRADAPVTLTADLTPNAPGRRVVLQRLVGEQALGAAADVTDMDSIAISEPGTYELANGAATAQSVSLNRGWTLFSVPLMQSQALVELLPAGAIVWSADAGRLAPVSLAEVMVPERGYWVYLTASAGFTVAGVSADGVVAVGDWVLAGPVSEVATPAGAVAWAWDSAGGRLLSVSMLRPGAGYWLSSPAPALILAR